MKVLLVFAFLGLAAKASVVYFDSSALTTANNSGFGTVDLTGPANPNPLWAPALPDSDWISYGPTGDPADAGYFTPSDGTVVTFITLFDVTGVISDATLTVLADDSTSVILNGHTLFAANLTPGSFCAPAAIGCTLSTEEVFTMAELAPYLVNGANELSFGVVQMGANSFGLDFAGNLDPGETPEPATAAFIGAGLIALAIWHRQSERRDGHHLVI
jgi:hypothetical protein